MCLHQFAEPHLTCCIMNSYEFNSLAVEYAIYAHRPQIAQHPRHVPNVTTLQHIQQIVRFYSPNNFPCCVYPLPWICWICGAMLSALGLFTTRRDEIRTTLIWQSYTLIFSNWNHHIMFDRQLILVYMYFVSIGFNSTQHDVPYLGYVSTCVSHTSECLCVVQ